MNKCTHCGEYFPDKESIQAGKISGKCVYFCIPHYNIRRVRCNICYGPGHVWYRYFSLCVDCIHMTGHWIPYYMKLDKDEELPPSYLYRIRAYNKWGFNYYCKIVGTFEEALEIGFVLMRKYYLHMIHVEQEITPTVWSFIEAVEKEYE